MKDQIKKVWRYIKDHKEIFIVSGITAVSAVCLCKTLTHKPSMPTGISSSTFKVKEVKKLITDIPSVTTKISPDISVGDVGDAVVYNGGTVELWMDNLKIDDIGKLGEEITEKIPNVSKDAKIWALIDIRNGN